ncbi:MAG TPA: YhzD family protein [Sporosarcina sp.]|nr:YhzD family protein [Sporosarcina sp.]
MKVYKLTAYEKNGTLIIDESIEASNDEEAKEKGETMLAEKELTEATHRLASPTGKLVLFHS